jgi:hypothetical protein
MPQHVRPSTVIVTNAGSVSEGHLKITLELNINLNSNGIEATVTSTEQVKKTTEDDFTGFEVPDFKPFKLQQQTLPFGKKVE